MTLRLVSLSARQAFSSLFSWNSPALVVSSLVISPVLQMLFFVALGRGLNYASEEFLIVGNALQAATVGSVSGLVSVISDERRFGTLAALLASPASRVAVFVGRLAPGVLSAVGVSVTVAVLGVVLFGVSVSPESAVVFSLAILAGAFSGSCLGLCLSAVGLVHRDIYQLSNVTQLALLVCSGAIVARSDLPGWLEAASRVLPLVRAIAAVRTAPLAGQPTVDAWWLLAGEVGVGAAWLGVAMMLMRVLESAARRRGSQYLT